jgi:hypothetical protein
LLEDEVERRAQKQLALRMTSTSTPASTASRCWIWPPAPTSARNATR